MDTTVRRAHTLPSHAVIYLFTIGPWMMGALILMYFSTCLLSQIPLYTDSLHGTARSSGVYGTGKLSHQIVFRHFSWWLMGGYLLWLFHFQFPDACFAPTCS